jgi:3-deoxy-7-phosphoheptulonate synthase
VTPRPVESAQEVRFGTSGSSGTPVGWVRTPEQLRAEAGLVAAEAIGEVDHIVNFAPIGHLFGHLYGRILPDMLGITVEQLGSDPLALPQLKPGTRTLFVCLPSSWLLLRALIPQIADLPEAVALHGTGPVTPAAEEMVRKLSGTGFRAVEIFGSTETGAIGHRRIQPELSSPPPWRLFSDVRPFTQTPGTERFLTVSSPRIGRREEMATAPESWPLEDLVQVVDDKHFHFVGRGSRLIKVNGVRCHLGRIEESVRTGYPQLDVACVPVSDRVRGEHYELVYATNGDDPIVSDRAWAGLAALLRGQPLPRAVRRVDRIPRSATGKVQLARLASTGTETVRPEQQPAWSSADVLSTVCAELRTRDPLVEARPVHALRDQLGQVAAGHAMVLQGGDCAELFQEATPSRVRAKAAHLDQLADLIGDQVGVPVIRIGRIAGQYSKPRSSPVEVLPDGQVLAAYRGDAVNSPVPTESARRADPRRLLQAYDHAAAALSALSLGRSWPALPDRPARPIYTSHEALLLDFEQALVRPDSLAGGVYASSAHLLWIGERTRRPDGPHLAFAESVNNPIGVKIGPQADPEEVAQTVARLTHGHRPGRLTLICRLGAAAIAEKLPTLLDAVGPLAHHLVWLCDPMHGNTRRAANGQKTRVLTEMVQEVAEFFTVLQARGVHPGGLHLETTSDPVTECVDTALALTEANPLPHFESACDPRLNPDQAHRLIGSAIPLIRTGARDLSLIS